MVFVIVSKPSARVVAPIVSKPSTRVVNPEGLKVRELHETSPLTSILVAVKLTP